MSACYDVSLSFLDQKEDVKKLHDFVKLDSNKCFNWDDILKDFIKNELGKEDPDFWINKNIENGVLAEPILGKLQFLVDFGGDNK